MKRRVLTMVTIMVLCMGLVAGVTLAYLKDSDTKDNPFSFLNEGDVPDDSVKAVEVELAEPSWSWQPEYQFQNRLTAPNAAGQLWENDASKTEGSPTNSLGWGVKLASGFAPGVKAPKDPTVRSRGYEATFVGAIVSVDLISGTEFSTLAAVENKFIIEWNVGTAPGQWTQIKQDADGNKYFVYNGNGAGGSLQTSWDKSAYPWQLNGSIAETQPLFRSVTPKHGLNESDFNQIDKFNIVVDAYGVQANNPSWADDEANYKDPASPTYHRPWNAETAFMIEFGEWR